MSGDIGNEQQEAMRLRVAFLHWAACLAGFIVLWMLGSAFGSSFGGWFGLLALLGTFFWYFAAGVYLNRGVLRKIIVWHPMYNTLYNVTSEKLKFFFLWPITYFFLFVRLGINKAI